MSIKIIIKKAVNLFGDGLDEKLYADYRRFKNHQAVKKALDRLISSTDDEEKRAFLQNAKKYYSKPLKDIYADNYFPAEWANNILKNSKAKVFTDSENGMHYVELDGKRMYYPKFMTAQQVSDCFVFGHLVEQNEHSPHRYQSAEFCVQQGDILADVGGCEGNFTLMNIDKISKGYIFECDESWAEALKQTFKPYKDKVEIVQKYVSDENSDSSVTLDSFFADKQPPSFIKADIEGAEEKMLKGAKNILSLSAFKRAALCVYHGSDDETKLIKYFDRNIYDVKFSNGYMFFFDSQSNTIKCTKCLAYITKQ